MIREIAVAAAAHPYVVSVGPGALERAGAIMAPFAPRRRAAVAADEAAWGLHGATLTRALNAAGIASVPVLIPPGEASKSWAGLERLSDALLDLELDRGEALIAFGGGVAGDLAGLAAALYKRGIDYVQVPTTLLAQVDSSVGGKTAIDTRQGKNLIGAFHPPRAVIADTDVLVTLPDRELACGYAEVVKHGLLADAAYFEGLERAGDRVLARDPAALTAAVARSVEIKADIVSRDEREGGVRALLNLGHTFAHAFEAEAGPDERLKHGEAVALGCVLALRFSEAEGLCAPGAADRVSAVLARAGLPVRLHDLKAGLAPAERLAAHMGHDKKAQGGSLTLVLCEAIGRAVVRKGVAADRVAAFLRTQGAA
jgi:3-dehydroquinate synthase